jgi:hypothetical protein
MFEAEKYKYKQHFTSPCPSPSNSNGMPHPHATSVTPLPWATCALPPSLSDGNPVPYHTTSYFFTPPTLRCNTLSLGMLLQPTSSHPRPSLLQPTSSKNPCYLQRILSTPLLQSFPGPSPNARRNPTCGSWLLNFSNPLPRKIPPRDSLAVRYTVAVLFKFLQLQAISPTHFLENPLQIPVL